VPLHYANLDERTREFMVREIDSDIRANRLYISPRLSIAGRSRYPQLLREAAQGGDDASLAARLRAPGMMNEYETRRQKSGKETRAKVPVTAPETLAEGEFNRYYARGLCLRAMDEGIEYVVVYRAKAVAHPRPESEAMLGRRIRAQSLLEDLRTHQGVEPALGLPPGPNSGLSVRLPDA